MTITWKMNREFWEQKYGKNELGWDIGYISPPLKTYIDQLEDKQQKILVPGAGHGYEVAYLHRRGFTNAYALDITGKPLKRLKKEVPDMPDNHLIQADFFEWEAGGFDHILEQTFFCAQPPSRRKEYVRKMYNLLRPGGKLAGLLFDFPLTDQGPPFGGSLEEYRELFGSLFKIRTLERAYNSIPQRQGTELFFIFEK